MVSVVAGGVVSSIGSNSMPLAPLVAGLSTMGSNAVVSVGVLLVGSVKPSVFDILTIQTVLPLCDKLRFFVLRFGMR